MDACGPMMVACSERKRLRGLLVEAINMLCKTSLKYKSGFSIEGLLGITIDNNQVFLVNIQEEVKNRSCDAAEGKASLRWEADHEKLESPNHTSEQGCDQNNGPIDLRTNHNKRTLTTTTDCDIVTRYAHDLRGEPRYKAETHYAYEQGVSSFKKARRGSWDHNIEPHQHDISFSCEVDENSEVKSERGSREPSMEHANGEEIVIKRRRIRHKEVLRHSNTPRRIKNEKHSRVMAENQNNMTSSIDPQQDDEDIIFIKDEDESVCSSEGGNNPQVSLTDPTKQPLSTKQASEANQQDSTVTPSLISNTEVQHEEHEFYTGTDPANQSVSLERLVIDEPVCVKIEDESSSRGSLETGDKNSPPWCESSPHRVTYEAGTWAEGETITRSKQQSKRREKKSTTIQPTPGDKAIPTTKTAAKPRKRSKKAKIQRKGTTVEDILPLNDIGASVVEKVMALNTNVVLRVVGETLNSQQTVPQLDADQTEWPADLPRRPRTSYSTAYKLMIVRKAIESGNMRATARRFGIHFKQVWQWSRNKEKLLAMSLSALRSPRLCPQIDEPTTSSAKSSNVSRTVASKATPNAI